MGLDCSHDAFHGAYSAFNRLRSSVCEAMGGSWPDGLGLLGGEYWYWGDGYGPDTHHGLLVFLNHSDCDGEIAPGDCEKVAADLEALAPKITEEGGGHLARYGGCRGAALAFAAGCRRAAAAGEPLDFH